MNLSEHDYRTLPRISNSDLSELEGIVTYRPSFSVSRAALHFGTAFHAKVLEPAQQAKYAAYGLSYNEIWQLDYMKQSLDADSEITTLIANSDRETVRLWDDPETGLPCKGKLDAVVMPRQRHLIDLKTTSCKTKHEFEKSIIEYGYDRQAAFYLDSDIGTADYFEFVAVCKIAPYPVFRVALHRSCSVVETGRSKNRRLLRRAAIELERQNGWRPKSWSRKQEDAL